MPTPHWRVWVDWDADGIWGESNEDVTPDVMELRWEWGRELERDRARPGLLDLVLRNDTHKYSPPNGSSPLTGKLKAGRRVWASLAYPYDHFTGTDGTNLAGRALPVDGEFAWVKQNTGANGFDLIGNQVRAITGGGVNGIYTVDLGDADACLGFKFNRATNAGAGVVLRFIDVNDYLAIKFGSSNTILVDHTSGVNTTLRSGTALTAGVNYFIEVEMHGPSIRAFATDLDSGAWSRREILDGGGNAGNTTATKHGLWHGDVANTDRWDDFGGWRSFFYGLVDSIVPRPGRDGEVCQLRAYDDLKRLEDKLVFNLVTGSLLRTDLIADSVLTWAGFSVNDRELDVGRTLVANQPRALWRTSARDALYQLQDEEDGFAYFDGQGFIRMEASGHRVAGAHTTPRATFRDTKANSPYFSHLSWDDGSAGVENDVAFRYHRESNSGLNEIWRLRDVPAVPAGATRDFLAESLAYDVVENFITPVATTDYTANSAEDGSGTNLTSSLAVSLPLLSSYQGKGTVVRVVNNHATSTAYVTFLRLRADKTYQDLESTLYQTGDTTSQADHGVRSRLVDCRFIDHYAAARDAADARLTRKKNRKTRLTLTLPNGDKNNLLQMIHRRLSDRITVVYAEMGINQDFFIEQVALEVTARTGAMTMRWLVQGV
jgi:hypothetical protein